MISSVCAEVKPCPRSYRLPFGIELQIFRRGSWQLVQSGSVFASRYDGATNPKVQPFFWLQLGPLRIEWEVSHK
jgi:hypothetical protein